MSKITQFDRATCRLVGQKVEELLKTLGEELGISFQYKSGSYTDTNVTMKIEAATLSDDGQVNTKAASDFQQLAKLYHLEAEDLGKEVMIGGEKFVISGLRPRASKKPVLLRRISDNKDSFVASIRAVQYALGRKVTPEFGH